MDINDVKVELEERIRRIEDLIEDYGVGSSRLKKAKKLQRNVNVAIVLGSLATLTGLALWVFSRDEED